MRKIDDDDDVYVVKAGCVKRAEKKSERRNYGQSDRKRKQTKKLHDESTREREKEKEKTSFTIYNILRNVFTILGICIFFCSDSFCPSPGVRDPYEFLERGYKRRRQRPDAFSPTSRRKE